VAQWAQETRSFITGPRQRCSKLQQYWAAKSPDVDVYMVDVIWQGILAPHSVDLKKYFKEDDIKKFLPRSIENNTVGGKLASIPWFIDAGILYYRTDFSKNMATRSRQKHGKSSPKWPRRFRMENARLAKGIFTALCLREKQANR
jgi:ABC-type glycerol-3-phosphate transport system substrate-binding protein